MWDLTIPGNQDHDFYVLPAGSQRDGNGGYYNVEGHGVAAVLVHNDNNGKYGAGGGSFCGAYQLMRRVVELNKMVGVATTAVVRVRNLETNVEQTWVASSRGKMPPRWGKAGGLNPGEIFKPGPTGKNALHAEQNIINSLFNQSTGAREWGIIEGGTSTGMCYANCYPKISSSGLGVGYDGTYKTMKPDLYSPYRLFWSP